MRTAGFAILGFLAGMAAGAVAAYLLVFLIYDVLELASHGADGLSGFGTLILLALVLCLGGGIGGAIWFAGKAKGAGSPPAIAIVAAALAILLFFLFFGFGGIGY
jgi:hypothetical protein